jgi:hypothetical protein
MIYSKYNYIKKSYNFNIKLNYDFKTWKNQASITLAMVCDIVIAPKQTIIYKEDLFWQSQKMQTLQIVKYEICWLLPKYIITKLEDVKINVWKLHWCVGILQ